MSGSVGDRPARSAGEPGPIDSALQRVADGDRGALTELYDRLGPTVYALARRRCVSDLLAETMVLETFLLLWRSAPSFRRQELTAEAWIVQQISLSMSSVPQATRRAPRRAAAHPRA